MTTSSFEKTAPHLLLTALSFSIVLLVHVFFHTHGTWNLVSNELRGSAFDSLGDSFLNGEATVDFPEISSEAFWVNGKIYMYFGPFPAILRVVANMIHPEWKKAWSRLSCLLADLLSIIAFMLMTLGRLRNNPYLSAHQKTFLFQLFFLGFGLGTPLLFLVSYGYIYHESIFWGLAGSMLALHFFFKILDNDPPSYGDLAAFSFFTTVSMLSRFSFAQAFMALLFFMTLGTLRKTDIYLPVVPFFQKVVEITTNVFRFLFRNAAKTFLALLVIELTWNVIFVVAGLIWAFLNQLGPASPPFGMTLSTFFEFYPFLFKIMIPLSFAAAFCLFLFYWKDEQEAPRFPDPQPESKKTTFYIPISELIAMLLPFAVGVVFYGWYNYARFGSPFKLIDFHAYNFLYYDPPAWKTFQTFGATNIRRLWTGFFNYFLPVPGNFTSEFPFVQMVQAHHLSAKLYFTTYREWVFSLFLASPWIFLTSILGAMKLPERPLARWAPVMFLPQWILILTYYFISQRFVLDFLPLLVCLSVFFLASVQLHGREGKILIGTLTFLVVFSIITTVLSTLWWMRLDWFGEAWEWSMRIDNGFKNINLFLQKTF